MKFKLTAAERWRALPEQARADARFHLRQGIHEWLKWLRACEARRSKEEIEEVKTALRGLRTLHMLAKEAARG